MKRFVICTLAVVLLAGTASAQTIWLQASGGTPATTANHLVLDGPSATGIVQLWMDVPAGTIILGMDAIIKENDAGGGNATSFEISGYNPTGLPLPNNWGQNAPRGNEGALPSAHFGVGQYQFVGDTLNAPPWTGADGVAGMTSVLLDEIVIHCTGDNTGAPDVVKFAGAAQSPAYTPIYWYGPDPGGYWVVGAASNFTKGTGSPFNPLLIENVPEPATLSLLVLGGLAALRRRR